MITAPPPITNQKHEPRRRVASVLKLASVTAFLFVTGGPAVIAQYDDNAASYWRQERQRTQARPAAPRTKVRSVEQRPTRLIRGTAPKKGFTRVVPHEAHPEPQTSSPETPASPEPTETTTAPVTPAVPAQPQQATRPPEQAQPAAPAVRIVVMGDNVGQLLARGLEQAYAETPQIAVSRQTRDFSGLANNRYFDWSDAAKKLLSGAEKVDIAIMMLGSNDAQEIQDGKDRLRLRSDPWVKAYKARIEAVVTQFRDKKVPLIWVGMPIMRGERLAGEMLAFNEIYRDAVQRAGGTYVDIWEAFVDDRNRFTLFGPDINGQIVKLRAGDGVHFTPAGSRKLAFFLEGQLKRLIDERRPRADPVIAALNPPASAPATFGAPTPQPQPPATSADKPAAPEPAIAALPARPPAPTPIAAPPRPTAGPVVRLTNVELAGDGELATRRRAAPTQSAFVQRSLVDGAPIEAQPGRADDFSWPRR